MNIPQTYERLLGNRIGDLEAERRRLVRLESHTFKYRLDHSRYTCLKLLRERRIAYRDGKTIEDSLLVYKQ
jgi:hypothetical protein